MTHCSSSPWLVGVLVLCAALPAAGGVTMLTADDIGVIRNPEAPTDCRLLVRFEPTPELRGAQIDLAVLELTAGVDCPERSPGLTLGAFALTSPWDGQSVDWSQGWDAPGGDIDRGLHAAWTATHGDTATIRLDVTEMMSSWLTEECDNHGLMIRIAGGEAGALYFELTDGRDSPPAAPKLTVWSTPRRAGLGHR